MPAQNGQPSHQTPGMERRTFLKAAGSIGLALGVGILGHTPPVSAAEKEAAAQAVEDGKAKRLTILQTADIHGNVQTHPELFIENGQPVFRAAGGYARIKSYFDQVRRENPGGTIIVDTGDVFQGSGLTTWSRGEAMVPILNAMGYDFFMPGNWEVQYGSRQLMYLTESLEFPTICANMFWEETGERMFPPVAVKEVLGVRVGLIGMNDPLTKKRQAPDYHAGIVFTQPSSDLDMHVQYLRAERNCDIVLALTHLGLAQQVALSELPAARGINFILGADTHERVRSPLQAGGPGVMEPGSFGSFVGRLDLIVQHGQIIDFTYDLVTIGADTFDENPRVKEIVAAVQQPYQARMQQVIGQTNTPLYRYSILEATFDDLVTDALRAYTGVNIAFSNGFRFGAPIAPGDVTEEHLWEFLPEEAYVQTGKVTGRQLWDYMESELEKVFAVRPEDRVGGWVVRFSGMKLVFTAGNKVGHRIQSITVGDAPLDRNAVYTIASYHRPGDPMDVLIRIPNVMESVLTPVPFQEPVRQYLRQNSPVSFVLDGRVTATDLPSVLYSQAPGVPYQWR